jgi:hypothetical protein
VIVVVSGVVAILVAVVVVIVVVASGNHTQYTALQPGDCYNRLSGSVFTTSVDKVDCSKPHLSEVIGSFQAADPGSYPGPTGFGTQTDAQCLPIANTYVGDNPVTGLRVDWLAPNQILWDSGSRTVVCGLQNADGSKHVGSVRG